MEQQKQDAPSAKFQAAVATIWCGAIEDYVTIMVSNDWTAKCTWFRQYMDPSTGAKKPSKLSKKIKQQATKCEGPQCSYVTGHRDKLFEEEQRTSQSESS